MTLRRYWPAAVALVVLLTVGIVVIANALGGSASAEAVGVVTSVDSAGLADVRGFTLRDCAGQTITFRMGVLENGAQFPPGHLAEHQATLQPIRVLYRTAAGDRVAYRLDDAPGC